MSIPLENGQGFSIGSISGRVFGRRIASVQAQDGRGCEQMLPEFGTVLECAEGVLRDFRQHSPKQASRVGGQIPGCTTAQWQQGIRVPFSHQPVAFVYSCTGPSH